MTQAPLNVPHGGVLSPDSINPDDTTNFDYLFNNIVNDADKHLLVGKSTVDSLKKLGESMIEGEKDIALQDNSLIPPVYTYWGQFIDHDITANTDVGDHQQINDITVKDLKPLPSDQIKRELKNGRQPTLNLDHVYGNGIKDPNAYSDADGNFVPYDKIEKAKLRLGKEGPLPKGSLEIKLTDDDNNIGRDIPRRKDNGLGQIGDSRNDENLTIAQLHVAFLRFHNFAVNWVKKKELPDGNDEEVFNRARELTTWSYQYIVVNDYLMTVAIKDIVNDVLNNVNNNLLNMKKRGTYMPLEFSVAAFRFGHSMVRPVYDWNSNFSFDKPKPKGATLVQLFKFTGVGKSAKPALPGNWPIEWNRMVNSESRNSARKIDTKIAFSLSGMINEGNDTKDTETASAIFKHLAQRNLLRGYLLSLPTGQAVARELKIDVLTDEELKNGNSSKTNEALGESELFTRTPLWFYILKESEVKTKGKSLGPVGSKIIAETLIGHLLNDKKSYLNSKGKVWHPDQGVKLPNGESVTSIKHFLRFARVLDFKDKPIVDPNPLSTS